MMPIAIRKTSVVVIAEVISNTLNRKRAATSSRRQGPDADGKGRTPTARAGRRRPSSRPRGRTDILRLSDQESLMRLLTALGMLCAVTVVAAETRTPETHRLE